MEKDALQGTLLFLRTPHPSTSTQCSPGWVVTSMQGCEGTGMGPVPCGCPQLSLLDAEYHGLGGTVRILCTQTPTPDLHPGIPDTLVFPRLLN